MTAKYGLTLATTLLVSAAVLTPSAWAVSIDWNATPSGDWFDPNGWNPAQVPTSPGDDAFVNNGGTAVVDTASPLYTAGSTAEARSLSIAAGVSTPGSLAGAVDSQNVDVETAFGIAVGVVAGDVTGADGNLTVDGASVSAGSVVTVGAVDGNTSAGATATGQVDIAGGDLFAAGGLAVGSLSNSADGQAQGDVVVDNGDLTATPRIGVAFQGGAGALADGSVEVRNGDLNLRGGSGADVGVNTQGDATAIGSLEVDNAISLSDPLNAGLPAHLRVGVADSGVAMGTVMADHVDTSVNAIAEILVGRAFTGGEASGELTLAGGDIRTVGSVAVGVTGGLAANGGTSHGTAQLAGTSLDYVGSGNDSLDVGVTLAGGLLNNAGIGSANGEATLAGASGFDDYRVGVIAGTIHNDVTARGELQVGTGGLMGNVAGDSVLRVGASLGIPNNNQIIGTGGAADGSLVSAGDVTGFSAIDVGISGGSSGIGTGSGYFETQNGDVQAEDRLAIGLASYTSQFNPDVAPTGIGTALIERGTVSLTDPVGAFLTVGQAFNFGTATNPSQSPVDAQGMLTLNDVTLSAPNAVASIGIASGSFTDATTTAVGTVNAAGGSIAVRNMRVGQASGSLASAMGTIDLSGTDLSVGESLSIGAGSGATGNATIREAEVAVGADLGVGNFNAVGGAPMSGHLTVENSHVTVGGNAGIGPTYQGGSGALELVDSAMEVSDSMFVGKSSNNQTLFGDGLVSLTRSLVDVGNELRLDIGAQLDFVIDGLLRGDEYGAFDVGTALLDGELVVGFNFLPVVTSPVTFDLIVSSLLDGIDGDFDQLTVTGLGGGYSVAAGVVVDQVGGQDVEIYRLTVASAVPEPATVTLMALGLAALGLAMRRSSGRLDA